jgi:hypothetical protein
MPKLVAAVNVDDFLLLAQTHRHKQRVMSATLNVLKGDTYWSLQLMHAIEP